MGRESRKRQVQRTVRSQRQADVHDDTGAQALAIATETIDLALALGRLALTFAEAAKRGILPKRGELEVAAHLCDQVTERQRQVQALRETPAEES